MTKALAGVNKGVSFIDSLINKSTNNTRIHWYKDVSAWLIKIDLNIAFIHRARKCHVRINASYMLEWRIIVDILCCNYKSLIVYSLVVEGVLVTAD